MSGDQQPGHDSRPRVLSVGTDVWCDPETGICALPPRSSAGEDTSESTAPS